MGLFSRKRYVVTALLVGVEGSARKTIFDAVESATQRIVANEDDFEVAAEEITRVAEVLLQHDGSWSQAGNWGEMFKREEDAGAYGDECFTDLAGRYLSLGEALREASAETPAELGTSVVMFTVAYEGEEPALEKTAATRSELTDALKAIIALARRDRLLLAHVHQSPGTREEVLTEDQLLVGYPELLSL